MRNTGVLAAAIGFCLLFGSAMVQAEWNLVSEKSKLSFITTKNENTTEVHSFKKIAGSVDNKGLFRIAVPLNSVETGVEIRNERMQSFLFETEKYAYAEFAGKLDIAAVEALAIGATAVQKIIGNFSLHGKSKTMTISVLVARLNAESLLVTSFKPFVVNAADFNLVKGIDKLRELANLPSISTAIPVSFVLNFKRQTVASK